MAIPKFPELEEQILKDWKEKKIFEQTLAKTKGGKHFVFYDGPPTANGTPHIGHVETRAFKDIIPRFKTMQGYRVERKAGWDTQGLPVELEVEKQLGLSGKKDIEAYGVAKFNAKARESVWKYKAQWERMTERIGFWLDLDHPYITYEPDYIETLWWIFKQTWDQQLLVQDYKVVPYCPRCGTALSSHEVAQGYQSVTEPAVFVKFELVDEPKTFVLAWTTTPWTLPGNVALAINPEILYYKSAPNEKGERYIVAQSLAEKTLGEEFRNTLHVDISKNPLEPTLIKGGQLVGLLYKPLFDFLDLRKSAPTTPARRATPPWAGGDEFKNAYTIIPADFVTTEDGTGVVHTAVMYGEDDFQLGKKIDLPKVHTVDLQGKFTDLVPPWAGMEVRDVKGETQRKIIAWLEEHGKLYKKEDYTHDYPFCWRCKHPLLYYAKTSWFIQMSKLRDDLIANNERINWYPAHIKEGRFGEWLREVKDWAISRERYWGTPLPIWQCDNPDCKHQECFDSYAEVAKRVPSKNRYILVRHGESSKNIEGLMNGRLDHDVYPLTKKGVKEAADGAKKLKKMLHGQAVDMIFTSPFQRAKETAEEYAKVLKSPVETAKQIHEYDTGSEYEDQSVSSFHRVFADRVDRYTYAPEGGETWTQIAQRMIGFLKQLEDQHEGKTFILVTHGDPVLVTLWAVGFLPKEALGREEGNGLTPTKLADYPALGQPVEIHFPAAMFDAGGTFDPHRPFIDGVTLPCTECAPTTPDPFPEQVRDGLSGHRHGRGPAEGGDRRGGIMRRVPEVADTWFDSGSMPFAQWHYPFENKHRIDRGENYPADYISEAIDQTRGWFYTLLAIGTLLKKSGVVDEPPYKNVVVLGHLNDAQGRKLSKSLGNYIDPTTLIDQHGADAIRFYLYTLNQPWDSKNFDPKGVDEVVKKTFLILVNVISFWELHAPSTLVDDVISDHVLDRWIVSSADELVATVTDRLERYDVTAAGRAIAAFITELSTWYVRRSRDRFKGKNGPAAVAVLRDVLLTLSKVMAPFTPFLADHVYHAVRGPLASVHLEDWPQAGKIDTALLKTMARVRAVVETSHALRAHAGIKVRQPLSQLVVTTAIPRELQAIVLEELNVKEIHHAPKLPTGTDWIAASGAALDTTVTDELKEEGMYRDLVREVNALRKEAGLRPSDLIVFHCAANTLVAQLVERFQRTFFEDIRAAAAMPSLDGAAHTSNIQLDGSAFTIGLSKK